MGKKSLTVNIICSMILGMLFLLMLLLGLILSGAVGDIDRTRITFNINCFTVPRP